MLAMIVLVLVRGRIQHWRGHVGLCRRRNKFQLHLQSATGTIVTHTHFLNALSAKSYIKPTPTNEDITSSHTDLADEVHVGHGGGLVPPIAV